MVIVTPVEGSRDLEAFIRLPWLLYKDDPHWIPPLLRLERRRLSPRGNAFFTHADVQLFIARERGKVVGRISAQVDHQHNRFHGERTGSFGFFETKQDVEIARALLGTAEGWLRQRGMERVRGPLSFSLGQEAGLLVKGFDTPPPITTGHARPYYGSLIEACGYVKLKDLYGWRFFWDDLPERTQRIADVIRSYPEVTVRAGDIRRFDEEVRTVWDLRNSVLSEHWGFVPSTEAEYTEAVKDLRSIIDPNLVVIAEVAGKPAGVFVCIPDLNEALRGLNGRLFPIGFLKLLWFLRVRGIKTLVALTFGVSREYRSRKYAGLPHLLIAELHTRARQRGYQAAQFSWTLEDNARVNVLLRKNACQHCRTYRIYEKALH